IRLLEMVQLLLLLPICIPDTLVVARKKSKTLLLSIRFPVLLLGLADPMPTIPLVGVLAPAAPILFLEMVLLLLPPAIVEVLNSTLPVAVARVAGGDSRSVQRKPRHQTGEHTL